MMRHVFIVLILLAWVLAFGAQGANLSYDPMAVSVTLEPGQSWSSPLTVDLQDVATGGYNLIFLSAVVDGNLPIEWLEPSASIAFVTSLSPQARTNLVIKVPKDAKPGTYSGRVLSTAMGKGGDLAESGTGVFVSLQVPSVSSCVSTPEFAATSVGPEKLWAPNNRLVDIEVSGSLDVPDGCQLDKAWYEIVDEYGEYSGSGELVLSADGSYVEKIPVEASRRGQDKDGRTYSITLFAQDDAGVGKSETITVSVAHDLRK